MSDHTKIEWADATVNAVNGCSVVSPGCTNCYAMRLAGTRMKHHPSRAGLTQETKAGPVWNGEVRLSETALLQPLKWKRPRRIFWNAHGDLFHENVPDEWIDRVFAVCALTPQHTHMILTKRSARMREYFHRRRDGDPWCEAADWIADQISMKVHPTIPMPEDFPLPNVWLGVSVEDQARADERIPDLLATPAAVRFISAEPLLGPVDLRMLHHDGVTNIDALAGRHGLNIPMQGTNAKLDWVICGGESGPGARPMHPDWARSLRDQCAAAGVAFHFKQWGEWAPNIVRTMLDGNRAGELVGSTIISSTDRKQVGQRVFYAMPRDAKSEPGKVERLEKVGKKHAGRLLDGRTHDEFPA